MNMTDLLVRPCDACGKPIGGGYKRCPKCDIYLCFYCRFVLVRVQKQFPEKCPMCGGEMSVVIDLFFLFSVLIDYECFVG
jgi:hypothetical protein